MIHRSAEAADARLTFRILAALPPRRPPKPTRQRIITASSLLASALVLPILIGSAAAAGDVTPVGFLVTVAAYAAVASLSLWGIAGVPE